MSRFAMSKFATREDREKAILAALETAEQRNVRLRRLLRTAHALGIGEPDDRCECEAGNTVCLPEHASPPYYCQNCALRDALAEIEKIAAEGEAP